MKVLLTTDLYGNDVINGVVTSVRNLKAGLEARGHEVRVLTLSKDMTSYVDGDIYYVSSIWMGYVYPKARARLRVPIYPDFIKDIQRWRPDVVHSNCEISTFHIAVHIANLVSAPLVHTYHTMYEHYFKYFPFFAPFPTLSKRYIRNRSSKVAISSTCVIVPTVKIEDLLKSYGIRSGLRIIPSGIDMDRFNKSFSDDERIALRRSLGISDDRTVLVYVGRMAKEKNIIELVRFMRKIKPKRKITMLFVGGGPYQERLKAMTDSHGMGDRVVYSGMIPNIDVHRYYKVGDLFVCASQSETQGLCYAEALSCGVPLLCRKDPCLEGVVRDGENGWVYESEEEFMDKLSTFVALSPEKKQAMRKCAKETSDMFSTPTFASSVENLYKELIREGA